MRTEITRWIEQAEADLKTARDNLRLGNYYVVALFCQQAVEKGLKALYLRRHRKAVPRTHSLPRLAQEVRLPKRFRRAVELLSPVYALARYPDIADDVPARLYGRNIAVEMLDATEVLFPWIKEVLLL